jgi:hypothetical protein
MLVLVGLLKRAKSPSQPSRGTPLRSAAVALAFAIALSASTGHSQVAQARTGATPQEPETLASALSPQAWNQVEQSIERALLWLSRQQRGDGSFNAPLNAQPAATSLAVMAYISKGHLPGEGPYGRQIDAAIDFVMRCQQPDGLLAASSSGVLPQLPPGQFQGTVISSGPASGKTANYNHGISGLMLTEVYGLTDRVRGARLKPAILKALEFSRGDQTARKSSPQDVGGWRYVNYRTTGDSDLSVTSWQLMFYRSARNAEFAVPKQYADDAVGYVLRCWNEQQAVFHYKVSGSDQRWSRGMVGAGILSLALGGHHDSRIAVRAGDWLMTRPFRQFGETLGSGDRFFYSTYYCSQAMAQLGGRHWRQFFPSLAKVLLDGQQPSGEWPVEPSSNDRVYGNTYTTALAVLSLTPPLQLLPVYQR